jgi:hypothetical protein
LGRKRPGSETGRRTLRGEVSSSPELRRDLFTLSKEELAVIVLIADDNQRFYEEKVPARRRREGGLWVLDSSPLLGYESHLWKMDLRCMLHDDE